MDTPLTESEAVTLVALLRKVSRLTTSESAEELANYQAAVREAVVSMTSPYRGTLNDEAALDDRVVAIETKAEDELAEDDALRAAVTAVKRDEAREQIFAAVSDLAMLGSIEPAENELLEWLADEWKLEVSFEEEAPG